MASSASLALSFTPESTKSKYPVFRSSCSNLSSTLQFPLPSHHHHHHHHRLHLHLHLHQQHQKKRNHIFKVSTQEQVRTSPDDLVDSILSKVTGTDGGVLLAKEGHQEVAKVALDLQKYCVDEPVKCPLIFGEWDVVYCSNPTSPGGGYRSMLGRMLFKATEMIQVVEAPDCVRNRVVFSVFGFLDGEVSLKGKLTALDDKWIKVVFEPPELKIGSLEFQYGGQSEVKLEITYIDEKIRLGKGSRGSLFVFQRC